MKFGFQLNSICYQSLLSLFSEYVGLTPSALFKKIIYSIVGPVSEIYYVNVSKFTLEFLRRRKVGYRVVCIHQLLMQLERKGKEMPR